MKKLLSTIFVLLFFTQLSAKEKAITFKYTLDIKSNIMHVDLEYNPVFPDSISFQYGNEFYGGMKDILKSCVNITADAEFKIDSLDRKITLYYENNKPIKISYDVIDTHRPEQRVVGEMFRPIITDSYFFSLSHTLFLKPMIDEKVMDTTMMSVTLYENPAFPMFFSFTPEMQPGETSVISTTEGMDALVTGASNLHIEKRELYGIKNYVVLRINGKDDDNLARFMSYFDSYLPAMNEFWGSLNGTYYLLVASPFLDIDYHDISGTTFSHGFHVKYSGNKILANDEVLITISHEIMHRYIGAGCVSLGTENQWFDEGFTDYTTWYLLSRCGIMPPETLNKNIAKTYEALSNNPVNNTPNSEVMKHFWDDHNYEKLPYNRGALFAAYIDKRINEISNGSKSYKDFMQKLKALAESKNTLLSVDDFISATSDYIPKDEIKNAVERYIMKGEMIQKEKIL